jgi:hypothetical protein
MFLVENDVDASRRCPSTAVFRSDGMRVESDAVFVSGPMAA